VQQPADLGVDRLRATGRARTELLSGAAAPAGSGWTQLTESPENPGRFNLLSDHEGTRAPGYFLGHATGDHVSHCVVVGGLER